MNVDYFKIAWACRSSRTLRSAPDDLRDLRDLRSAPDDLRGAPGDLRGAPDDLRDLRELLNAPHDLRGGRWLKWPKVSSPFGVS